MNDSAISKASALRDMSIGIVILAAGESARMGEPKQLLPFRDTTLLRHAVETAHSIPGAPVIVVLGAHADQIRAELGESSAIVVENSRWPDGMGGSLREGLTTLLAAHSEISAAIFLVCDQPLLSATTLSSLVAAYQNTGSAIVASEYGGTLGVPALFARELFPELLALSGSEGARQIIHAHCDRTTSVPFPEGTIDLDTPTDYAAFRENFISTPV